MERLRTGELVVGQCGTGHHATAEPRARGPACRVECLGLRVIEQLDGDRPAGPVGGAGAQLQGEARPVAVGLVGEVGPVLDRSRVPRHGLDLDALLRGEVAVPGGRRQRRRTVVHQTLVGLVDVAVDQHARRAVGVQVIDIGIDGEVVRLLNHTEGEAIPLEGARSRGLHMSADLVLLHEAQRRRGELDELGIGNGPAGDDLGVGAGNRKSAVVGVVATDVGVDRLGHRGHVAPALNVPRGQDQSRDLPAQGLGEVRRPQMLRLLKARRQQILLGLRHDLATGRRCSPHRDRSTPGMPGACDRTDGDHVALLYVALLTFR